MTDDEAREAITAVLSQMQFEDGMIAGRWVLAYETAGITDDGEAGGNWGYLAQASVPVIVGLAHLVAAHARDYGDDD